MIPIDHLCHKYGRNGSNLYATSCQGSKSKILNFWWQNQTPNLNEGAIWSLVYNMLVKVTYSVIPSRILAHYLECESVDQGFLQGAILLFVFLIKQDESSQSPSVFEWDFLQGAILLFIFFSHFLIFQVLLFYLFILNFKMHLLLALCSFPFEATLLCSWFFFFFFLNFNLFLIN